MESQNVYGKKQIVYKGFIIKEKNKEKEVDCVMRYRQYVVIIYFLTEIAAVYFRKRMQKRD